MIKIKLVHSNTHYTLYNRTQHK